MDAGRNDHPDEGTIHAWLDGALDAPAAAAFEAHVVSCPSCTALVAEARGLIAGASRVVGALDDVPSGVAPAWGVAAHPSSAAHPPRPIPAWRRLRVTPARAAIAATILVALGVTLTRQHIAPEMDVATTVASVPSIRPHDALLDSAVKRNIAAAVPPRTVEAVPGPSIPVPPAGSQPAAVRADTTAGLRVAVGRSAMRAQVESRVAADRAGMTDALSGAVSGAVSEPEKRALSASRKADSAAGLAAAATGKEVPAASPAVATGKECYRVESANGTPATWGAVPLPFVVALDTIGRVARVQSADGTTDSQAIWRKAGDDSLTFQLRRIGYTGTLALGGAGDVRPGVMRSSALQMQLSEVVVTSADAAPAPRKAAAGGRAKSAAVAPAPAPTPTGNAAAAAEPGAAQPAVAVVARRVSCTR